MIELVRIQNYLLKPIPPIFDAWQSHLVRHHADGEFPGGVTWWDTMVTYDCDLWSNCDNM